MNALDMKLEGTDIDLATSGRCTEGIAKKFKNTRKKVNPINCVDKELQQTANGLRCEPIPMTGFDSKECWTFQPINAKKKRSKKIAEHGKIETKTEKVQERLELSLSEETKKKIIAILNDIRLLSDVEKLLLYLQLPTGASLDEDPLKQKYLGNPLGKKADEEGTFAVTWIQSHLEEDPDVSLPKQEVYDEYQSYCEVTGNEALCAADFGKVMKQIFPSVKPRRLGTRGNSRYCYSGLRKKTTVQPPSISNLQVKKENLKSDQDTPDDTMTAACHVLLEWAEKLLDVKFTSVKEVASYLIDNMLVDNRSVAAFTLLLSSAPEQLEKSSAGTNLKCENKNRKSETQIHLQRKIQEKELIKEQKRKLQLQRSCLSCLYSEKPVFSKKKNLKGKKIGLINGQILKDEGSGCSGNRCEKDDLTSESLPSNNESKISAETSEAYLTAKSPDNGDKGQPSDFLLQCRNHSPHSKDTFCNQRSTLIDDICDNPSKIDDAAKKETTISALSDKTPVCISQSLPGFIIVPSLSQIQLKDIGKSCNKVPKYKRIQPKPLNEFPVSSTMRCRTGSLGSLMYKENKSRTDGRRSSLALLHSDFSLEFSESNTCQKSTNFMSLVNSIKIKSVKSESNVNENLGSKSMNLKSFNVEDEGISSTELFSNRTTLLHSSKEQKFSQSNMAKQSLKNNVITNTDDAGRTKRHFEDADFEVATKKPHLDDLMSSDISSESLSPWTKDINSINCNANSNFPQNDTSDEQDIINRRQEEVSIHELESDALIDYLHGAETESSNLINDENNISQVEPQLHANSSQNQDLEHSEFLNDEVKSHILNPEMNQLSQLRMLLEQNLPHAVTKPARSVSEIICSKKPSVLMHTNDLPLPLQIELIGKNRREILNNDMSEVFLRNNNPYLNSECDIASSVNGLISNQLNSESLLSNSSDLSSQGLITEQDLLTAMGEQLSLVKNPLQIQSSTKVLGDIGEHSGSFSFSSELSSGINIEQSSAQTQIPSVPPSPNTRRRAFNFMPISPRHTPVPDALCISQPVNCYSPVLVQQPRNMVSVGVGPSQPPSNAGSPFVSPRSTPVPPSRSRHSSGQSSYSTSRHTPFQNIDSGVSSISSSPFISPQPTPVPVSRLRHNSSHGPCKTVTFSTANNNQVIHTLSSTIGHGPLRLRHSSGPGGPPMGFSLLSPRSAPLSPLVNETGLCSFNFPPVSETRSRHNSGLTTTPLSPVSEQVSAANNSKQSHEIPVNFENLHTSSEPFITDNSAKEMIGLNSHFKLTRQRHASSSVIHSRISVVADPLAHEVQHFLKNESDNSFSRVDSNNRSRSVPLHQMLRNLANSSGGFLPAEDLKPYTATLINKHSENIPMLVSSPSTPSISLTSDSLILHCDKSLLQPVQNDWVNLDSASDMEMSATRKNLSGLMEVPLGDDLQTTLEDLRDCDTDFSKFAQELEQEFSHSGDGVL